MAQPLEQFAKSLLASGLPFAAEFEAWLRGVPKEKRPADGEQCARVLVKEKKLTAYQAQELYAGRGKKLALGNYVVLDKLGQGGMGVVLKAEHKRMGRIVAIKVVSTAGMANPDAVKRFQREVQAAAKLAHQNIVTAFDADEAGGQHFLVMEYVEGSDLSQLVKKNGPMSIEKALHCVLQAARGLEFAHSKGIVHRDIKPANLLLDSEGTIKILDMGLARLEHSPEQGELTGTGQIMGTVDYMAPEQAMSTRNADGRADIYSLGITLWYLLTGRVAYEGDTLMAKLMAHSTAPIPYLASVNMQVSPSLERVFQKMVAKTPPERFQSMAEVIAALEEARTGREASPTLQVQKSEDSKLSEFLKGMGPGQASSPGRSGIGSGPPLAVAPAPALAGSTNAALDQTINTGHPQTDTDPQADASLVAPPAAARPAVPSAPPKPWHADWRVWTFGSGGLGAVMLIGLIVLLMMRGGSDPGVKERNPKKGPAVVAGPNYFLEFDGQNDYVDIPSLTYDGTSSFTLEAFVTSADADVIGHVATIHGPKETAVVYQHNGRWYGGRVTDARIDYAQGPHIEPKRSVHLAFVWDGKENRLFVDGRSVGIPGSFTGAVWPKAKANLGGSPLIDGPSLPGDGFFRGAIDEVRFSKIARYDKDFVPPSSGDRFAPDAHTIALYHFDEGARDVLKDSSGNNHHGKIVGAKWVSMGGASPAPGQAVGSPAAGDMALEFDGKASYVVVNTLPIDARQAITVEAWVLPTIGNMDVAVARFGQLPDCHKLGFNGASFWALADYSPKDWKVWLGDRPFQVGQRVHVAGIWLPDGTRQLFVGGRRIAERSGAGSAPSPASQIVGDFMIGAVGVDREVLTGILDELRVSRGVRYAGNFAPVPRFTADSNTLALYHFDEGQGDTLKDSSGNNRHGKIVGAKWVKAPTAGSGPSSLPPGGDYAIEFDGNGGGAFPGIRLDLSKPLTLEAYLAVTGPSPPGGWPAAFYAGNRISLTNDGGVWGFRLIGGEDLKLPHQIADARPIELGRRYHVAGVSTGQRMLLFVDGQKVAEKVLTADPPARIITDLALAFKFAGRIDELRASQSARYLTNFTPPASLAADAETLGLYHCDEGSGDVLKDSSGKGADGKLAGAKWVGRPAVVPNPAPAAATARGGLAFSSPTDRVQASLAPAIVRQPLTVEVLATIHRFDQPLNLVQIGDADQALVMKISPTLNFGYIVDRNPQWAGTGAPPPPTGKVVHLAGVWTARADQGFKSYVNGVVTGEIPARPGLAPLSTLTLGGMPQGEGGPGSPALTLHAVRISKVARDPKTFTPDATFQSDADTIALYQFTDGSGDVLKDSSGNNHHGKIVGGKWVAGLAPPAAPGLVFETDTARAVASLGPGPIQTPLTLEAWITPQRFDADRGVIQIGGGTQSLRLFVAKNGNALFGYVFPGRSLWAGVTAPPLTLGQRIHIAGIWDKQEIRLYVQGVHAGRLQNDEPPNFRPDGALWMGQLLANGVGAPFTLHAARVSKVVRYSSPFEPQSLAADRDTLALYRADEGSGDVLQDASGNQRDAKIFGATWTPAVALAPASGGALEFDGKTSYVEVPSFSCGEGPYTVELWATPNEVVAPHTLLRWNGKTDTQIRVTNGQWYCEKWQSGLLMSTSPAGAAKVGVAAHLASVWNGKESLLFVNGVGCPAGAPLQGKILGDDRLWIGAQGKDKPYPGVQYSFQGRINGVRISKTARYAGSFQPRPRWTTDADTLALYQCDEGSGDTLKDSSGNNHHGKIVGAKWVRAGVGWRPLFNGKDLAGWTQMMDQAATWSVGQGELICRNGPAINHLVSRDSFADFDLIAEAKVAPEGNSGIFFRTPGDNPFDGHELEIGSRNDFHTGDIVGQGIQNGTSPVKENEWFTVELSARGGRFVSKVNGKVVHDWTNPGSPASGKIALQCIPQNTEVRFRRIDICPVAP